MRARVSRAILSRLEKHTPSWVRCLELQILMNLTARAFRMPGMTIWNKPAELALRQYADYTVKCMTAGRGGPKELYREAYKVGRRVRRITGLTEKGDAERLVFYLYRNIEITMDGSLPGEVLVPACYFSRFYEPEQCSVMSMADAGIIAGICGGGRLHFTQRISEGCTCCRAEFYTENK